jgi:hypothetical protein
LKPVDLELREVNMIVTNYTAEDLKKLPLRAIVALAARCARRVERLALLPVDHPENDRCRSVAARAIGLAEDFAKGMPCSSLETAVQDVEAARAAAKGDFVPDTAMGSIVLMARAAANAAHALDLYREAAASRKVGSTKPDPLGHLADAAADVAARDAFTAAFESVTADGHSDSVTKSAIDDYKSLLLLDLGIYPEEGKPIDPSSEGPLGPLEAGGSIW